MPIEITCACGATYNLKDEFAGQRVQCPRCSQTIEVGQSAASLPPVVTGDPIFARDQFLLRQKHLSISEKYYVWDEGGQVILYVERPAHLLRNIGAALAGILAGIIVGGLLGALVPVMPTDGTKAAVAILAILAGISTLFVVAVMLSRKRNVNFYRDDTKGDLVMQIFQEQKVAVIHARYTIADAAGNTLARLDKNYLYNIFRKRWYCHDASGALLCLAKEDSVVLSLLRRLIGPFFGLLRTNFIIVAPGNERVLGEFNRKLTILDRYSLSMTGDPDRTLDRRIALAIGVMLDTGERR